MRGELAGYMGADGAGAGKEECVFIGERGGGST